MSWQSKVVWSEGLFLRPQLFQQQERYLEHYAHKRAATLSPFFFGFSHYCLDSEALALGSNARRDALRTINGAFDVVGYPVTVEGTITASVCHDRG